MLNTPMNVGSFLSLCHINIVSRRFNVVQLSRVLPHRDTGPGVMTFKPVFHLVSSLLLQGGRRYTGLHQMAP